MDPVIWGPKLWNIFYDVCFRTTIYSKMVKGGVNIPFLDHFVTFFDCFAYMLPCDYCRQSYKSHLEVLPLKEAMFQMLAFHSGNWEAYAKENPTFLADKETEESYDLPNQKSRRKKVWVPGTAKIGDLSRKENVVNPNEKSICAEVVDGDQYDLIRWIHRVKNRVNNKLHREPRCCLSECLFRKRLNTYSSCASTEDVWDILFILAINYDNDGPDPEITAKKRDTYKIFFKSLPIVLSIVPHFHALAKCLSVSYKFENGKELVEALLASQKQFLELCKSNESKVWPQSYAQVLAQYDYAKAMKTPEL